MGEVAVRSVGLGYKVETGDKPVSFMIASVGIFYGKSSRVSVPASRCAYFSFDQPRSTVKSW